MPVRESAVGKVTGPLRPRPRHGRQAWSLEPAVLNLNQCVPVRRRAARAKHSLHHAFCARGEPIAEQGMTERDRAGKGRGRPIRHGRRSPQHLRMFCRGARFLGVIIRAPASGIAEIDDPRHLSRITKGKASCIAAGAVCRSSCRRRTLQKALSAGSTSLS